MMLLLALVSQTFFTDALKRTEFQSTDACEAAESMFNVIEPIVEKAITQVDDKTFKVEAGYLDARKVTDILAIKFLAERYRPEDMQKEGFIDPASLLKMSELVSTEVWRCKYGASSRLQKSDADGLFKLMDANVTRGNLKNLVTDKPAPITVALAQKSDADGLFKLMDANV